METLLTMIFEVLLESIDYVLALIRRLFKAVVRKLKKTIPF